MRHQSIPCRDTLFIYIRTASAHSPILQKILQKSTAAEKSISPTINLTSLTAIVSVCRKKKGLIIRQYLTSLERSSLVTADNIWLAAKAQYSEFTICFKLKMSWSSWVRAWSSWYGGGAVVLGGSDCPLSRAAERMQRMLAKEWSVMSSILQRETISSCQTLLSLGVSIEDIRFWIVSERRARCPESLQD